MTRLLLLLWDAIRGPLQWRVLWLLNSKFMVNASGVVTDDRGQVLLLRHRFWPAGTWGIPGGYIHAGETVQAALVRELHEETGLAIEVGEVLRVNSGYRLRMEVILRAHITGGDLSLDKREILEAGFFSAADLPNGLLSAHREIILAHAPPAGVS